MLSSYFIVAWRNIRKQPVFSVINIAGLSIGMAAFWLIALYIGDELSYDRYHKNVGRVYRVVQHASWKESGFDLAPTSAPFAPTFKAEYPEVEQAIRISPEGGGIITVGEKSIQAGDVMFADKGIFDVFSYKFIAGTPSTALAAPQTIVLTRSLAETLFGDPATAIGKTIYFDNNYPNSVTAVIEDVPVNSHFRFRGLRSLPAGYTAGWQDFQLYTYLLLRKGVDVKSLETKLPDFYKKHLEPSMGHGIDYRMELQPLSSIHLQSNLEYELASNGNMQYIYVFSIIGLLVLIIAAINYMNLSTARASYRVKEIGVRKVIGSGKTQLVFMFLAESVLICVFAGGLAILIAEMVMPLFNELAGKELSIWRFGIPVTLLLLFAFTVVTGFISGIYPAFFMSGFLMIPSLKGQIGSRAGTALFRKGLVTFQFVITIMMIAGSFIVYEQLSYIQNKNLGLNKDQVLTFHIDNQDLRQKTAALKEAFLRSPLIESVSAASNPIGNNNIGANGIYFEDESGTAGVAGNISASTRKTQNFMVDGDFLKTLDIGLAAGRNYSEQRKGDQFGSVLVNETLVKELGWKHPVGKRVQFNIGSEGKRGESVVVGVVKDFHIYSLQHKLEPLILAMPAEEGMKDNLYVKVSAENIPAALSYLQKTYLQFDPAGQPEFHFLSENFNNQYKSEQKQGALLLALTVLAISIACLGLFGLVTFTAVQKSKEIGIRKVLGASVASIVKLLSVDLLKLVAIAFVIATPMAWVAMNYWLQDFAYQVTISWSVFLIAGGTGLLIALITLSIQAIRSALANPVKSLKAE